MYKEFSRSMMRGKLSGTCILVLSLAVLVFATACSKNSNTSNGSSSSNTSSTSSSGKTSSGSTTSMSPTEVFKAYYDAALKRDFATAKQYLSKSTMDLMEAGAKAQGKTVDEAMKESPTVAQSDIPQMGNEQINGDTATVEVTAQGQTMKMPFVKENGGWKIAMDKFMSDAMGKMGNSHPPSEGNGENENSNH
jgi:hypothetical protein